jgi:hypothetical protein
MKNYANQKRIALTLNTLIRLTLVLQYPDHTRQAQVRLVQFDDYWLVFAVYFAAAVWAQAAGVVSRVRLAGAEWARWVMTWGWLMIPYGPG